MPRKHLLLANFASLAAFLAVRGGAARAGLVALLVGLCPWACAKVKEASAEAALATGGAVALVAVADAAATPARKTLSGGLEGMQGEAVVTLLGGGADCALEPGGGFGQAPAPEPKGVRMPYGVLAFSASGCTGSITVQLTYPEPLPPTAQLWKLGPATQGATTSTWFAWSGAQFNADRRTVTYTVQDNGVGDSDPAVGGIRDPPPVAVVAFVGGAVFGDNTRA
ncbi:MAG: hypothetical protein O9331_20390, partial [Acidovorax sp.]|nr:hypothetical protein [Acidovorax sp.]